MKKVLLVLKTEIINVMTRRSFIILTFGLPIVAFVLFTVVTNLNQNSPESLAGVFTESVTGEEVEGYVDYSGIIKALPSDVSPERIVSFIDEASAYQALENGEVNAFYIIPENVIETREIVHLEADGEFLEALPILSKEILHVNVSHFPEMIGKKLPALGAGRTSLAEHRCNLLA